MKRKDDTVIEFSGLKPGVYDFVFNLGETFFRPFQNDKIADGEVVFHVKMEKTEHLMVLTIAFSGTLNTVCDRCLAPLALPVSGEETVNVKFSDTAKSESCDEIVLPLNACQLDLGQQCYEMVAGSLPIRCVHPMDASGQPTCDPEMLTYLQEEAPQDEDEECAAPAATDPRWAALQSLKDKDEESK